MTYGSKIALFVMLLSFFFLTACSNKNFSFSLYDGYEIRHIDNTTMLYKDQEVFKINDTDYNIKEFKFNSDVVCLKLENEKYYMIYYVDGTIYGPYSLDTLNTETTNLSMTFEEDFKDITKIEGKIYE